MSDICDIKVIVVKTNEEVPSADYNDSFEMFDVTESTFGYRKLSFMIDKIKPDAVYVDSGLLNLRIMNCIGFTRKVVCFLKESFNEATVFKRKSIQYVASSEQDKERFESLSKKKKYHAHVIEQEYEKASLFSEGYLCSFIGSRYLRMKYREAVELFVRAHNVYENAKFSMICDNQSYSQLDEYFKKNQIVYIDLFNKQSYLKDVLESSKSVVLLSSTKADSVMMNLYKMSGNYIIYDKPKISSINEDEIDTIYDESDDQYMVGKLLDLYSANKKANAMDESKFLLEHYRYQYINLFML